jgi:fibronectin-binding autotransporter adhesin
MRHLGLLVVALSVCLLSAGLANAGTVWWAQSGPTNWSAAANWQTLPVWTPSAAPGPSDTVEFNSGYWGGQPTLDTDVTVSSFILTGYSGWNVLGSSTLNSNTFTFGTRGWAPTGGGATTFTPRLNLSGTFYATENKYDLPPYPAGLTAVGSFTTATNADTFGGGFNVSFQRVNINGNNNTINGGITVEGTKFLDWYSPEGGEYMQGAGFLSFGGTGNTFGAQAFNLNQYGTIDFTQSTNLSAITAINFNGGMLKLESTSNTFGTLAGGFNVVSGALWITSASSLGDPALNAISLGGKYSFGMLTGGTNGGAALTQNITLNGQGGIIRNYQLQDWPNYDGLMGLAGNIGGSGALLKTGSAQTWLMNGAAGLDTFTGGTVVVDGTLGVQSGRSLGTGNVKIYGQGSLQLQGAGNVASGALVGLYSNPGWAGAAVLQLSGDWMPTIDPTATNGVIQLYNPWTWCAATGPIATALGTGVAGDGTNGNLVLGGQNWGGFYGGAALAPDEGNVYRLGSNAVNMEAALFMQNQAAPGTGVLIGNNSVILNYGEVIAYDSNSFTGKLTIHNTIETGQNSAMWNGTAYVPCWGDRGAIDGFYGYQQAAGLPSALGDPAGNIVLENGVVGVTGNGSSSVGAVKADLSYDGQGIVALNANGGTAQLTLSTLTRQNSSSLIIDPTGYATNTLGTTEILLVNGTVPVDNIPGGGTMVKPYIVAANGPVTGSFVNYNTTTGFTTLPYVAMPASGGAGSEIAQTAGATVNGSVNVWALRADGALGGTGTIDIGSGGLILTSDGTDTVNFKAGDGTAPLVIFRNYSGTQGVQLSGTITAGGLVLNGFGRVYLSADNSSTLVGNIYINQGSLAAASDASFGAPRNNIILNGGDLHVNGSGFTGVVAHNVQIGPAGGWIDNDYAGAMTFTGTISDLEPGNSGLVIFSGGGSTIATAMTNTGGTEFYWGGSRLVDNQGGGGNGKPGPGPVIIAGQGSLNIFYITADRPDMSTSAFTIMNGGIFQLATVGAKIGSLSGDGHVHFGDFWSGGYYHDMVLSFGYDNKDADFYGDFDTNGGTVGAALEKWGAGTQTLWGNVNIDGTTKVYGGTLRINGYLGTGDLAKPAAVINGAWANGNNDVTVNTGGTLDGKGIIDRNVNVNAGGHLNGSLHITGAANIYGGTANVTGATIDGGLTVDTDQITYTIPGSYSGSSTINGDSYIIGGSVSGTHTFNGSLTMDSMDGPASLSGTNTINGSLDTWGDPVTISGTTVVNNPGGTFDLTGSMTGSNTINLGTTGTIQLNPYGYGPTVFGGTGTVNASWFVIHPNTVVSGTYTFNSKVYMYGGTFQGNHTVHGTLTTAAGSHAIITPHNDALSAGTLTIVGDVSLDHSTTLNFNLASPGTSGSGINDLIDITGNLSLDGTLNVNNLSGFGAGTYRLFNYTGTLSGAGLTQGTMPTGLGFTYTIDTSAANQVNLDVVTPWIEGDTDHSGGSTLNSLDIDAIYHHFGQAYTTQWKVAKDTNPVGQEDVTYELTQLMHTNYGDANLDRFTDFTDFQVLLDHWQATGGWAQGDFNGDGTVDFLDFQVLLDYWNPGGWNAGTSQVPEPASLSLILLGGLALLRRSRRA